MTLGQIRPDTTRTQQIRDAARTLGFELSCTPATGALLTTLAASKPGGTLLELGTGVGVGTSYLAAGLGTTARLVTVDLDDKVQRVARQLLGDDSRITFITGDGGEFLQTSPDQFDLIFADAWPGKFTHLSEALGRLRVGGFYVIDDLLPQPTWPEGHAAKVPVLLDTLAQVTTLARVILDWDTGVAIYVRTER
jgi:predicted O-methyltransferase YrrM